MTLLNASDTSSENIKPTHVSSQKCSGLESNTNRFPSNNVQGLIPLHFAMPLAMSLWLALILQDWLCSSTNPYPYEASVCLSMATIGGFVMLLSVRHVQRWFSGTLLVAASVITGAVVKGSSANHFLFPATIVAISFATPIILNKNSLKINKGFTLIIILAACVGMIFSTLNLGAMSLISMIGGISTSALITSIGRWSKETLFRPPLQDNNYPRIFSVAILLSGLSVLWGILVSPLLPLLKTANFWTGTGLGSRPSASFNEPFIVTMVGELGAYSIAVLGLLLLAAAGILLHIGRRANDDIPINLCAGGIGTIYSLLLSVRVEAPFFTIASIPSTWAFVAALTAVGLAVLPEQNVANELVCRNRQNFGCRKKWSAFAVLCTTVLGSMTVIHLLLSTRVSALAGIGVPTGSVRFIPLAAISQPMQDATIAMEDGNFYIHHGFDWTAMHRALRTDLRDGRIVQGGSTITQQLAKNLFLSSDRTIWRKLAEAAYTCELEHTLTKKRILELYLNTIDYGCGQHGVVAAAAYYFHKTPAQLTLADSALLVGLVPHPPRSQEEVEAGDIVAGQKIALSRLAFFFPYRYSQRETTYASQIPLDQLIYPNKDALDRGAIGQIPAVWYGVGFYFFADPTQPNVIDHVSPSLKPALAAFLTEARKRYHLTGIDHLGVYNDRPMRQSQIVLSAHAFGQAIDISGFHFADGENIQVANHTDPHILARLVPLENLLKNHFPIVVDWRDDPLRHQTHFHCEVRGPRPSSSFSFPTILADANAANKASSDNSSIESYPLKSQQRYELWQQGSIIRQTTPMSCGPASLATVLTYYLGRSTSTDEIVNLSGTKGRDSGAEDLEKACTAIGYRAGDSTMTLTLLLHQIEVTNLPLIALWTQPLGHAHWVVVVGQHNGNLLISNPNRGNVLMSKSEFCSKWGGNSGEVVSIMATD